MYKKTPISYLADDLKLFTSGFSSDMFIADCYFGNLYHGSVPNRAEQVTVVVLPDRLQKSSEIMECFEGMKFAASSSIMKHPGFVRPVGFCSGLVTWGAVLDVSSLCTLNDILFDVTFTWPQRVMVALKLAQSLNYLHNIEPSFLLGSLNKSQIIIDKDFSPKLMTFGKKFSKGFSNVRDLLCLRTVGYVDLDISTTGMWSTKSDVYTYGILMLELISMSPMIDRDLNVDKCHILRRVPPRGEDGKLQKPFVHEDLQQADLYFEEDGYAITELAVQCVASEKKNRPNMGEVIATLERLEIFKVAV